VTVHRLSRSGTLQVAALTRLRALAAGGVFFAHVEPVFAATPWATPQYAAGRGGGTGVVLFFVLSGYLLARPSAVRGGPKGYFVRRVARIYPVYLIALALMLGLLTVQSLRDGRQHTLLDPGLVGVNLLLAQAWSPAGWYASVVYPAWSLSVEVLFYALLPYLLPRLAAAARHPRPALAALGAGGVLGATGLALHWWPVTFPPAYLPVFLFGAYLAVSRPRPVNRTVAVGAALTALAAYTALATVTAGSDVELPAFAVLTVPYGLLVHSLATAPPPHGTHRRPGRRQPLVRLGEASYAFFLVHGMVISVFTEIALPRSPSATAALGVTAAAFVTAWALAIGLYRAVELPAQALLLRRFEPVLEAGPAPTPGPAPGRHLTREGTT
jgi:peptidoglycan/LPS O-acetylase OafA/YrhL